MWEDRNRNGVQDDGEPGVAGVTVNLLCRDGEGFRVCQTRTTNADGHYRFSGFVGPNWHVLEGEGLSSQDVQVEFLSPRGFVFTAADAGEDDERDSDADPSTGLAPTFTINEDFSGNLTIDAGLVADPQDEGALNLPPPDTSPAVTETAEDPPPPVSAPPPRHRPHRPAPPSPPSPPAPPSPPLPPPATGAIGGVYWKDVDGDGLQDLEEQRETAELRGSLVALVDPGGQPLAETAVDEQGRYQFAGLAAGSYRVVFPLPGNGRFEFTVPDAGDDSLDSDVDPATSQAVVTLAAGETNTTIGAGIHFTG